MSEQNPIVASFTVREIPKSDINVPLEIKKQWLELALPVRQHSLAKLALGELNDFDFSAFNAQRLDVPVSINGTDAVNTLRQAGRTEAAEFWTPYEQPVNVFITGNLAFRAYEGTLDSLDSNQR